MYTVDGFVGCRHRFPAFVLPARTDMGSTRPKRLRGSTWRLVGSYKWGYKSRNMSYKYSCPTKSPSYNYR